MADWVVIAQLTRPRGKAGELAAVAMTDYPERYQGLRRAFVGGTEYAVERVWYHKERPIFKFQGVDSISAAEALAGKDVCVPAEDRLKLPEGEYFFSDLVGCRVVDAASGAQVGTVSGWQEIGPGSPVLLEVDAGGRDPVLVPFASKLLKKIDVKGREIRVELPEGLAELNR